MNKNKRKKIALRITSFVTIKIILFVLFLLFLLLKFFIWPAIPNIKTNYFNKKPAHAYAYKQSLVFNPKHIHSYLKEVANLKINTMLKEKYSLLVFELEKQKLAVSTQLGLALQEQAKLLNEMEKMRKVNWRLGNVLAKYETKLVMLTKEIDKLKEIITNNGFLMSIFGALKFGFSGIYKCLKCVYENVLEPALKFVEPGLKIGEQLFSGTSEFISKHEKEILLSVGILSAGTVLIPSLGIGLTVGTLGGLSSSVGTMYI
ncbi:MAG: hypothetical protein Q8885_01425 [Candidatus Phytoplasma stylosanthis]|nr:hypothetical protein [Candidatus Phytoplasma stylosanthis]